MEHNTDLEEAFFALRPGVVQRGTPLLVDTGDGQLRHAVYIGWNLGENPLPSREVVAFNTEGQGWGYLALCHLKRAGLDMRSPTAQLHGATPYTEVQRWSRDNVVTDSRVTTIDALTDLADSDEIEAYLETLVLMRSLARTVSVPNAKTVLAWAETALKPTEVHHGPC